MPALTFQLQYQSLLLFILFTFFFPTLSIYSPPKISYPHHCNSIVPQSTPTGNFRDYTAFQLNGYFSGGEKVLSPDTDPSSTSSSNLSIPGYFYFYTEHRYVTKTPGVIQLDGSLVFEGKTTESVPVKSRYRRYDRFSDRKRMNFFLSGFWSETSGKLCMVGSDLSQNEEVCAFGSGCKKVNSKGTSLEHLVVLKLNYPKISNISTSLVSGTVESLDPVESPNHFDTISMLAYAQMNYSYTMISQVRDSCSHVNAPEETLGLEANNLCSRLPSLLMGGFRLKYEIDASGRKIGPLSDKKLGFSPNFIYLNQIQCSEDGKVYMNMGFSERVRYRHGNVPIPETSLVGEGFWDNDNKKLCLLACPILNTDESPANFTVGDCSIGLSFWFPSVFSIRNRTAVLGEIWSNKNKNDPGYFNKISLRGLGSGIDLLSGWRYEYTELDSVKTSSCLKENENAPSSSDKRYPDGYPMNDMRFEIALKKDEGNTMWGFAAPITFGEKNFYGESVQFSDMAQVHFPILEETNQTFRNVSYRISYNDPSLNGKESNEISAEGIYNAETGKLCMVGCQYPVTSSTNDHIDCQILINIHVPPINREAREYLTGKISSTREKSDPLYFEPLEVSSSNLYQEEAVASIWRMDVEISMVLISLTLSCIFILFQLFHVKKNQEVPLSISMLAILTVGQMIPLVLNFEALFFMNRNKQNVLMWSGGWIEANEVIVRAMTMMAFLLQFHLLQSAWTHRSAAERKVLMICLPLYFAGGLIAWFVHSKSYGSQTNMSEFNSEHPHSLWEDLISYAGLILDGFLLPQIILNTVSNSKGKALNPLFYIGTTVVRAMPHVYDAYRTRHYLPRLGALSYMYASPDGDLYSSAWDIIVPLQGFLFASVIYLQQRFGGGCFLPQEYKTAGGYEMVPVAGV